MSWQVYALFACIANVVQRYSASDELNGTQIRIVARLPGNENYGHGEPSSEKKLAFGNQNVCN